MITRETSRNLTIFRVTGEVTANDIVAEAVRYMVGEETETSLWDFTRATKIKITTLELKGIADSLRSVAKNDTVRKVALVASKNINIGLGKVFGAFAQMASLPYTYKTFRNIRDAMQWLEE